VVRLAGKRGAPLLLLLLLSPGCHKWHSDRSAAVYLKTIVSAEEYFRSNDRGEYHVHDFWVKDVAGLYGIDPGKGPIALIVLDLAQADRTAGKGTYKAVPEEKPYIGYYFATLKRYGENGKSITYDSGTGRNPSRFGLVAFPAEYSDTSKLTFIINEKHTVFSRDTKGKPPEEFPEDPVKDGWTVFSRE
jgi:hypothetical protein